ncbi:MAG TPA: DnaB-like helicase C-terminal domain-containing protein [Polyangiaceae bacterium]|nr:DnaB-like helicase C-terminal domain-containing protein [Polyangiaceae bacterium]
MTDPKQEPEAPPAEPEPAPERPPAPVVELPRRPGPRVPPHAVESEAALVADVLLGGAEALSRVRGLVAPKDFFDPRLAAAFEAAFALEAEGSPVDPVAAATWLRDQGRPGARVAGELAHLLAGSGLVGDVEGHARAVRGRALLREGIRACQRLEGEAYRARDAGDWLAYAAAELQALELEGRSADLDDGPGPFDDALAAYDRAADAGGDVDGLQTGFFDLDYRAGLLKPEALVIVAGRPGMGKSSLAGAIAANVASRQGGGPEAVLFATLEMPRREIAGRMACAEARVDAKAAERGELTADESHALRQAFGFLRALPFGWLDEAGASVAQVEAAARALRSRAARRSGRLALVVVDYLQLCKGRGDNREQEVASVSRDLKAMAKRLKAPVVALAQLNRAVEGRSTKRPVLSDLRESGAIEQDADRVLFLHRPDYYDPDERPGECEVIIAKNRGGPTGDVTLRFDATCTRFDSLERRAS